MRYYRFLLTGPPSPGPSKQSHQALMAVPSCDFIPFDTGRQGADTCPKSCIWTHPPREQSNTAEVTPKCSLCSESSAADLLSKLTTPLLVDTGTSSESRAFSQPTEENRLNTTHLEGRNRHQTSTCTKQGHFSSVSLTPIISGGRLLQSSGLHFLQSNCLEPGRKQE